jgi:hypothetical protein
MSRYDLRSGAFQPTEDRVSDISLFTRILARFVSEIGGDITMSQCLGHDCGGLTTSI